MAIFDIPHKEGPEDAKYGEEKNKEKTQRADRFRDEFKQHF